MSTCRYCPAKIRWVATYTGKLMPLDAEPDPAGNVEIIDDQAVVHGQVPMVHGDLYMPHFATCPGWGASTAD